MKYFRAYLDSLVHCIQKAQAAEPVHETNQILKTSLLNIQTNPGYNVLLEYKVSSPPHFQRVSL